MGERSRRKTEKTQVYNVKSRQINKENHRTTSHFLFGVSAKHLSDEVSTTVSQNATTGSATLISENQIKRHKHSSPEYMDNFTKEKTETTKAPHKEKNWSLFPLRICEVFLIVRYDSYDLLPREHSLNTRE